MFDVDLFIRTTNTQINLIQYGLKFNLYATNCCHLLRPIQTTYRYTPALSLSTFIFKLFQKLLDLNPMFAYI